MMACNERPGYCVSLVNTGDSYIKWSLTKSQISANFTYFNKLNFDPLKLRMRSHWPKLWTGRRTRPQVSKCQILWGHLQWHYNYMNFKVHVIDFHWKYMYLLLLWPWQRSNWPGWWMFSKVLLNVHVSTLLDKNLPNPKMKFVPLSKVSNVKICYIYYDLENKVKVM